MIENYSRLGDLDLEVRGHLVVVGANDAGKTSLLRGLNLALGPTSQLYQAIEVKDVRDSEEKLIIQVTFEGLGTLERAAFHQEIDVSPDKRHETLIVRLEVAIDPDDSESVLISRWCPGRGDVRNLTREQIKTLGWRYLPAQRQSPANQLEGSSGAIQTLLRAVENKLGEEKTAMSRLVETLNDQLDESETLKSLRNDVAGHLSKSMPRTIDSASLAIRTSGDPNESVLANASFYFSQDDTFMSMSEQSDGMRQLISMSLFDLAEGAANVIAIDEPEIHLHPASQRTVADLLTHATTQKIIATHSPYIVQRFDPEQVVAVRPDGSSKQLTSGKFSFEERHRAHWWSSQMLEALTARFVILVEGIADRLIVEAAARASEISLDRIGAVVLELGGAENFPEVYKLLGPQGFGVDVLGLVDEAEKGKWLNAVGGRPKHVLDKSIFVSKKDLEDEYSRALGPSIMAERLISAGVARDMRALLSSCQVASQEELTETGLADFCRSRSKNGGSRKVPSALAVAKGLRKAEVQKIASISSLLKQLGVRTSA